jgi:membrane protein DedA with SNARE-associated domain
MGGAVVTIAAAVSQPLQAYGYWTVFAAVAVESLGVPLPGETTLIGAALYAGSTHRLSIGWVVGVAAAAAIIGDNIGYLLGRAGGYRLLRRYGRYVRLDERKLKVGRYLFDRHGGKVVFFGRFISILRTYAAFLAGTNRMPWRKFLIFNAAGGILWAAVYGLGAFALGTAVHRVTTVVSIVGGLVAVAAVATIIVYLRRHLKTLEQRAEQAYPGPPLDSASPRRTYSAVPTSKPPR